MRLVTATLLVLAAARKPAPYATAISNCVRLAHRLDLPDDAIENLRAEKEDD